MEALSAKVEQYLIDLAWSLWTELGVAGVIQQHQHCLIMPEELILLTAVIAESDPRLRDEALDWCSRYHYFISISRLRTLIKAFDPFVAKPFSRFAATLNSVSKANWPLPSAGMESIEFVPSGKSKPPRCERAALFCLRIRALFGVGARADLILFFLTQKKNDFTAADATEIGYSKSSLAELLDRFVQSGFCDVSSIRNQRGYCFAKRDQMAKLMGVMPESVPSWRRILEVVLPLRECIRNIEDQSGSIKMVEIRSTLAEIEHALRKLNLAAPPFDSDFFVYWDIFSDWILKMLRSFAQSNFELNTARIFSWDERRDAAKRIEMQFRGLFSNIASLSTYSNNQTKHFLFENYRDAFRKQLEIYLSRLYIDDQKMIRSLADTLLLKKQNDFTASLKDEIVVDVAKILEKYL